MQNTAFLSNEGRYTRFEFRDLDLKVIAPKDLLNYVEVISWEDGMLTVIANYENGGEMQEYIDIEGALEDLLLETAFLTEIKNVEIRGSKHT